MDKYEQITKLAEAYSLITEVISGWETYNSIEVKLQDVANNLADISDEIEGIAE